MKGGVKMFRFKNIIFLCFILLKSTVLAADIESLRKLFVNNFNHYYQPRYCGKNIKRLLSEAQKRNIDLSNSYILKVVGDGFFETSGFYTRAKPNQRAMLGYFHMILVADNMVFDFDLHAPLVLDVRNYIRLQFMPPYEPYIIYNVNYTAG